MATYQPALYRNRSEEIEIWQARAYAGGEATTSPNTIASLFDGLMSFLRLLLEELKQLRPEPAQYNSLENNTAALFFWGRDLGVSHGELDTALQHSSRLRDIVVTILISMGDFMSQGLIHVLPANKKREEILKTSNITTLIENAKISLKELEIPGQHYQVLSTLSSSLECPAEDEYDDEAARAWVDPQDRSAHEWFAELVGSRYPLADKQLIESLGRSNWDRYNHVQKLGENVQDESETVATNKARSEFHDSGLGSSAPAQSVLIEECDRGARRAKSEYAATIISSRAESSHKRLPPLPEEARSGEPFTCEVCKKEVHIRRTKEWKKHIFEDIRAYNCIFSGCSFTRIFFTDRETMANHLESQHGISHDTLSQSCPLCLEQISGGRDIVSLHFARHTEEIALGILSRTAESEDGSEGSDPESDEEVQAQRPRRLEEVSMHQHRNTGGFTTLDIGTCPLPECGRVFKNFGLKTHMLLHQNQRPEKCPISTCEYHTKGFSRRYDKNRHTLTHYKGTIVCGFCPVPPAAEKSFNRLDVFKRHLTSVHGVERNLPNSRKKSSHDRKHVTSTGTGICSTCSVNFKNAQELYEHLDDCVFRIVQQDHVPSFDTTNQIDSVPKYDDDSLEDETQSPNTPIYGQRQAAENRSQSPNGDSEDIRWPPEINKLYEDFLDEESKFVTQGQWDQFPMGSRLFIGNLPTGKDTKRDIFHQFFRHGKLAQISIKQAYGYVQFLDSKSCAAALQAEQGQPVRGRKIHLEISKPQRNTK